MPNWCSNSLIVSTTNDSKESKIQLKKFVSDVTTIGHLMPIKYAEMYRELYIQERFDKTYRDNAVRYVEDLEMDIKEFMMRVAYFDRFDEKTKMFIVGESYLEMNNIYPVPKELVELDYDNTNLKDEKKKKELIEKYGFKDTHDWCVQNWGTKWEVCEVDFDETQSQLTYNFQTAWSPIDAFIRNICENYPLLDFNLTYLEEGAGFEGELYVQAGNVQLDESRDYVSKSCCLCGEDCEDDEELNDNGECLSCAEINNNEESED
jgi:hypothetical protein